MSGWAGPSDLRTSSGNRRPAGGVVRIVNVHRLLVGLLLGLGTISCGDDTGTPATVGEMDNSDTSAGGILCAQEDLDAFIDQFRDRDIDVDYKSSVSPMDLASRADVVVSGNASQVRKGAALGSDAAASTFLMSWSTDTVLHGETSPVEPTLEVQMPFNPEHWSFPEIAEAFEPNARGVLFLENHGTSDVPVWRPLVEGVWMACESAPRSLLADPEWSVATTGELEAAVSGTPP